MTDTNAILILIACILFPPLIGVIAFIATLWLFKVAIIKVKNRIYCWF